MDGIIPPLLSLFLFLLDLDDFTTFIESTIGADGVRKAHRTAIRTSRQIISLQGIMGAAHIAAALRVFALWMWGH